MYSSIEKKFPEPLRKVFRWSARLLNRFPRVKEQIRYLIHFPGGAGEMAWSSAIGAFVGVAVPEGLQTVTSLGAAYLLRMNFIVITFFTLITNPFTVIPIYLASFRIGEMLTGMEITAEQIEKLFSEPGIRAALELGTNGAIIFLTGSLVHGLFWGGVWYILMFAFYSKLKKLMKK